MYEDSTSSPTFAIFHFSNSHQNGCGVVRYFVLICICLMNNDAEHIFMYLLVICIASWRNIYSYILLIFKLGFFLFVIELYEFFIYPAS